FYLAKLNLIHVELSGAGWKPMFSLRDPRLDQDALEQHRAAQRAAPAAAAPAPPSPTPAVTAPAPTDSPRAPNTKPGALAARKGPSPVPKAESEPSGRATAAWTDFRGPNRDGVYTGGPIRTGWPSDGLKPLWRQPVGGGYASFVVAGGKAFTIEQRRQ